MWPMLLTGELLFWLVLLIPCGLMMAAVDAESVAFPALISIATLIAIQVFTDANLLGWAAHHLVDMAIIIAGYFAVGAGYSLLRWWLFCDEKAALFTPEKLAEARGRYIEYSKPIKNREEWVPMDWNAWLRQNYDYPQLVSENKTLFYLWIAYWPFSAVWTLTKEPIKRVTRFIYRRLTNLYQKIADRAFPKLSDPTK